MTPFTHIHAHTTLNFVGRAAESAVTLSRPALLVVDKIPPLKMTHDLRMAVSTLISALELVDSG